MRKKIFFGILLFVIAFLCFSSFSNLKVDNAMVQEEGIESSTDISLDPYTLYRNWKRPEGAAKVGIQVGHWKVEEVPDELENLRTHTGATGGGKAEWEVNMAIAEEVSNLLTKKGVDVEILPATIPANYWADVFIAIHADGSLDKKTSGYKFASPWRDFTDRSDSLVSLLDETYAKEVKLAKDPNITSNMRGYYAFSWRRYEHAIHPMTTAVIAETGFLTNKNDRKIIVNHPEIPGKAIGEGIVEYLEKEKLL